MELLSEWSELAQERVPLRKILGPDKVRLRKWLRETDPDILSPIGRVRLYVAAGLPLDSILIDQPLLGEAFSAEDIARNLKSFTRDNRVLAMSEAINVLRKKVEPQSSRLILNTLLRLLMSDDARKRPKKLFPFIQLESETAAAVLKLGVSLAIFLLRPDAGEIRSRNKNLTTSSLIDLAFFTCTKCERTEVAAAAIELLSEVQKYSGWELIETLDEISMVRKSYILALPSRLVVDVLKRSCIGDAELLAIRSNVTDESRDIFRAAVLKLISAEPGLPQLSRNWAEHFLGNGTTNVHRPNVSVESDINLERFAVLLISSWESRNEGPKSKYSFELFNSISKNSYHLTLESKEGEIVPFDPVLHELFTGNAQPGQEVVIVRPRVQYSVPPVTRVIVRALVNLSGAK